MFIIKREKGFEGNFPSFKTFDSAKTYIDNNTGIFNNNEIIALIDFEQNECIFIKLELTITARVL
jgi:hypothetical protein